MLHLPGGYQQRQDGYFRQHPFHHMADWWVMGQFSNALISPEAFCGFKGIKQTTIRKKGLGLQDYWACSERYATSYREQVSCWEQPESRPSHDQHCQSVALLKVMFQVRASDSTWLAYSEGFYIMHFLQEGLSEMDLVLGGLDRRPCCKLNPQMHLLAYWLFSLCVRGCMVSVWLIIADKKSFFIVLFIFGI